jgi:hypothetical protein
VFRAAVLSIVFAFAAAPEATLLCRLWCPSEESATGCHHHGQSSSVQVKAGGACDATGPTVAALTREDGRRVAPGSGAVQAVPVRYQLVSPAQDTRTFESQSRGNAIARRPLETILRL